jgi:hypothetical protein
MSHVPILAHGTLGVFDELIFVGVAAIFLIMMGLSWFVSRNAKPAKPAESDPAADATLAPNQSESADIPPADPEQADRFRLK